MKNLDIAAYYNLNVETYGVSLTSGAPTVLPSGPITFRKPIAVAIVALQPSSPTQQVVATTWSVDGNNIVSVTPTFASAATLTGTVAVFYQR